MKFRKRPVEIEAWRVSDLLASAKNDWAELPSDIKSAYENGQIIFLPNAILITTPEIELRGERDDWVIRGIKGELYPCRPDIFQQTYEPIEE